MTTGILIKIFIDLDDEDISTIATYFGQASVTTDQMIDFVRETVLSRLDALHAGIDGHPINPAGQVVRPAQLETKITQPPTSVDFTNVRQSALF